MFAGLRCAAIIAAAGMSRRMQTSVSKQFLMIDGITVIEKTLRAVLSSELIDIIYLIIRESDRDYYEKNIIPRVCDERKIVLVNGGKERQDSVRNALSCVDEVYDIILSHDGARPFVKRELIDESIQMAAAYGACCVGVPVKDTIKFVTEDMRVSDTPNRARLWQAQTPQTFRRDVLIRAYERAYDEKHYGTDDAMLVEVNGDRVRMIMGDYSNIKLTTPEDMILANLFSKEDS